MARHANGFLEGHRFGAGFLRRFAKGAVAAEVAAQIRQGDKYFRRKSDDSAFVHVAKLRRGGK